MVSEKITMYRTNEAKTEVIEQLPKTVTTQVYDGSNNQFLDKTMSQFNQKLVENTNNIRIDITNSPYNASANGQDVSQIINQAINDINARGGGVVFIPRMQQSYMIDALKSIILKDNVTLELGDGAVLQAMPNNSSTYQIIRIYDVKNASIIGRGSIIGDRNNHNGTTGEWGHGIAIKGATNVLLEGFVIRDLWGDGISVSKTTNPNFSMNHSKNVTIRNVISINNRRQGMSVITVDGLYVYDSEFNDTNGTDPQFGIDFEPDDDDILMDNIYLKNVKFKNNIGGGITINLNKLTTPKKVNMTFDDLYFENNVGVSMQFATPFSTAKNVGKITVNNPVFSKFRTSAVVFWSWNRDIAMVTFNNPLFIIDKTFNYTFLDASSLFAIKYLNIDNDHDFVGGLRVKNLSCVKTDDATILPELILTIINSTNIPIDKVSKVRDVEIIDPLDVSGLVNPKLYVNYVAESLFFLDNIGKSEFKIKTDNTNAHTNLAPSYVDSVEVIPVRNLSIANIPIGQSIKVSKRYEASGIIRVALNNLAYSFDVSSKRSLDVPYGAKLTIKRVTETLFSIENYVNVTLV